MQGFQFYTYWIKKPQQQAVYVWLFPETQFKIIFIKPLSLTGTALLLLYFILLLLIQIVIFYIFVYCWDCPLFEFIWQIFYKKNSTELEDLKIYIFHVNML